MPRLPQLAGAAFETARMEFAKAMARPEARTARCGIAGRVVEIAAARPWLCEAFGSPLDHLRVGARGEPWGRIGIWEDPNPALHLLANPAAYGGAATDAGPLADPTGPHDLPALSNARYHAVWLPWLGWLQFHDREVRTCLVMLRDAAALPAWEFAAPLRSPIAHLLTAFDGAIAHGAVVGWNGVGVLLAGAGGAGKSSTALRCLLAGAEFLGDDYVAVSPPDAGRPARAWSLFHFAKLREDMLAHFPEVAPSRLEPSGIPVEKPTFALFPRFADRFRQQIEVRAVLQPRLGGRGPARLRPGSVEEMIESVAAGTDAQVSGFPRSSVRTLERFTRALPCFILELGDQPGTIPEAIRGAIAGGVSAPYAA